MGQIKKLLASEAEAQSRFNFLDEQECNEVASNIVRNDDAVTQRIAKAWYAHATINKLKHNTEKRRQAQYYFVSGAVSMLDKVPMLISMCLASGRDLESVIQR